MKVDRKTKTEKSPPKVKAVKSGRRAAPKTNGKHPLAAYEHIPVGIVETSLDGRYIEVNEEFCRIMDYSRAELLELGLKDCTHEDDYAIDSKLHEQLVTGKIPFYRLEKRYIRKKGEVIWVELTRTLVCDEKGKPLYSVGVILDISERKDVERVLRESVERLRLATEAAEMFMWEWDFENKSYTLPDNFEQVLGFSTGLLPKNRFDTIAQFLPADDVQVISQAFKKSVENRKDLHALPCRVINPENGQIVWLEISANIVYDSEGKPERMFGVAQNITESKRAEAGLQLARRQAEEAADRKARLQKVTAALSGELTPPQVAEVVINQGTSALDVVSSSVMQLVEDGQTLELMYSTSQESHIRPYKRFPVSLRVPAADVVRSGETVWIESRQQYLARYPHLAEQINQWGQEAAIAVPMIYKEQILGVLTLSFDRVFPYSPNDLDYALTLARQGAQALDRARAAIALRESEERFRALVSQATAGIAQSDMESRLEFVNPRFCEMLGYSEEELLGKTIWELTYTDDLEENKRLFMQMLNQGESYQFEKRFLRKDGSKLWTSVSVSTIRDLEGNPKGGVGVVIEIEKRKQAEDALAEFARQQEALYQLSDRLHRTDSFVDVFNAALDAIINALQCDRASILLFDDTDVMRFVAWRGLSDRYRKATDGHSPWKPDTKDPEPIAMDDIYMAELDESLRAVILEEGIRSLAFIPLISNGKLIGKFMVYFDRPRAFDDADLDLGLTIANQLAFGIERKRAEEALQIENERFMRFVDANIVGILIGKPSGEVILANDYYLRLLGVSRQDFVEGKVDWKKLTPPEWLPADEKAIRELNENGVCKPYEKEYVRADGTRVPVYITNAMLPGPREEIAAFVVDITERKSSENMLRIRAHQQQAIAQLGELALRERDVQKVLEQSTAMIAQTLEIEYCKVLELLEGKNSLLLRAGVGWQEGLVGNATVDAGLDSQAGFTLRSVKPVVVEDLRTERRFNGPSLLFNHNIISGMSCIIHRADGKPWGVLGAHTTRRTTFTEDDVNFLTAMANILGDAIERQQADQALRQSEERYRAVVESQAEMLCRIRPDGTILFVNEAYARARGTTAEKLIHDNFWEFISEEDRAGVRAMLDRLTPEQPEVRIENRFQTVDGERWTLWTNRALDFDESGRLLEVQSSGIDITDRKRAEQDLRESEERYRFIVENTSDGIWWIELSEPIPISLPEEEQIEWYYNHAVIRQCNLGLARMYGYNSVEEVIGLPLQVVMPRENPLNLEMLRNFIRAGYRLVDIETQEIGNNGRELVFLNNMIGIVEDGKLKGEWGTNRDITERKRAEEALRESEERYRGIVNQTIAGIAETDLDGQFTMVNEHYCEITGYRRDQLLNKMRMQDITHPDDLPINQELFKRLTAGGTSFEIEKRYIRPDGSIVWVHNSVSAIVGADGKPQSAVAAVIDVTERKRVEEMLRRNEEMFSTLVEAAPFGVYFIDSEFRLRAVNKGSEAVFSGIYPLIGRDFAEILRIVWEEPFATEAIERFRHTLRTGESFISPPITEQRANIEEIQSYDWQIHRITMPDGTYGVVCYFYDLSEQKQMEATVRASESLYRAIARNIPGGGVYVVDKDFRYLVAEGPVTEAFGLTRETLEGRTVAEVFPDERGKRMQERLRKNFAGETVSFETKFNGRVYWTQQAPLHESIGQAIILTLDITERKQAEEALRQSEERFARFMQHLPGLAWIKDLEGRYVYANAAAVSAFRTPLEKLLGQTDESIFPPEVAAQFRENDEQALRDEKGIQVIETLEQEDGMLHYSLVSKFPIPGPDGNTALIGGTALDITERRQAEEALRESEERFRAIIRQATAGIVRKDAEGKLIYVNQAFCNMLGYTEAELLGKTMWDFMHEDDIAENKRWYNRLMMEGIPFKLERRLLREDGSVIWVDASVSPIMDATGKPQSAVTVEVDITRRKQAEEALQQLNLQLEERVLSRTAKLRAANQTLREEIAERRRIEEALRQSEATARANEEKLSTLFQLLPVGISFLDQEGKIIQMNPALANILNLSSEQLADQTYRSRKYIRSDGSWMSPKEFASQRALTEGKTVYNLETGVLLENSEVVWTSVSAAPVAVADVGAVVVTVDITENKRAERALQESRERLQILSQRLVEVQEEERRAIARELHDRVGQTLAALNINLIIISGQLTGKVDEQVSARLSDSMKLVAETITLVRDVMSNLRPSVLDDYGLEAALQSHINEYMSRYEINVMMNKPDPSIPRMAPSIEMTFLRIAQEALMNIARHAHASQVDFSLLQEEDAICMVVQDNGVGIESWQRANRPGSHGLTIMRERAEAFGGSLMVSSVPSQGTRIEVRIPFEDSNPSSGQKEMRQ